MTSLSGNLRIETPGDLDIVFTRMFNAPAQLVFDAHTRPNLVRQWMSDPEGWTMPACEIDLQVGGRFRYVWRRAGETADIVITGVFKEIAPPHRFVHTEIFEDDWTGGETLNITEFVEHDRRTTMTLTVRYSSSEARAGALATGMADGMERSYARLDTLAAAGGLRG
jgi:uncharacterized protein YndB with AHSA1/START domain